LLPAKLVKKMIFENVRYVFLVITICFFNLPVTGQVPGGCDPLFPPYSIVITEIMADPSPVLKLPDAEYIEILNRSSSPVHLKGIRLCIGTYQCILPDSVLSADSYAILCDKDAAAFFNSYGPVLAVSNFPAILNTGQVVSLLSPSGSVIHTVTFSPKWYKPGTEQGGYSLEVIDPQNFCGTTDNWTSATDSRGGTPASINSVMRYNPDTEPPYLVRCTLPADTSLLLCFSEPLFPCSNSEPGLFSVNNGFFDPVEVELIPPDNKMICLSYRQSFSPGIIYNITVADGLTDCTGNISEQPGYSEFGIPSDPGMSDIVFNELLFDAPENDAEFIEIFNRSEKIIDLESLEISFADYSTGNPEKTIPLNGSPFLLMPDGYVVITKDAATLLSHHPHSSLRNMIEINNLFTLTDTEGALVLTDSTGNIIDEFRYTNQFHHPLINESEGLSIERISPDLPSDDPDNWMTASTLSGYATPGYENSVLSDPLHKWELTCSSDYISPDNDGIDDIMTIRLESDHPGIIGSLAVYTLDGETVCTIEKRSLSGTDEYLEWDGKNGKGEITEAGIYLLYGEFIDDKGNSKIFKKVISVVRK
jgi:hypothetical protein